MKVTTTDGKVEGVKNLTFDLVKSYADGTGSAQATGFFDATFTATTGGITLSLASADPLGAAGDDTWTSTAEGAKLRVLVIENQDASNYVSLKKGTNGDTNIFSGATDSIRIDAGGIFLWVSPAGSNAMSDGADDELIVTSNSASVVCRIAYVFG